MMQRFNYLTALQSMALGANTKACRRANEDDLHSARMKEVWLCRAKRATRYNFWL
jgi:hypothetical protein